MASQTLSEALKEAQNAKGASAQKAAELLRSAADRLEQADPDETAAEWAARLRGSAVLAHTAALELAVCSGWLECLVDVELAIP
jgi:hypothetical protein